MMRKQKLRKFGSFAQYHTSNNRYGVLNEDPGPPDSETPAVDHYWYCLLIPMDPGEPLWASGTWFLLCL